MHLAFCCPLPRGSLGATLLGPPASSLQGMVSAQPDHPGDPDFCLTVRTQHPTQTLTEQVTLQSVVLCVFSLGSADVRQMEPEAHQGPHADAEPRDCQPLGQQTKSKTNKASSVL